MIRLGPSTTQAAGSGSGERGGGLDGIRRGFDYEAFEARLESLWFQRSALIEDGRDSDGIRQAERIRSFCAEEGVHRLEHIAGALVAESADLAGQGRYDTALQSLDLAEVLDPELAQVHIARAHVMWNSGHGWIAAGRELVAGVRISFLSAVDDLTLIGRLGILLVVACAGAVFGFALLMFVRYHVPFRHEIEEWLGGQVSEPWARLAGWTLLLLPLVLWFTAGWIALYWIAITFRFMQRSERITAAVLLVVAALSAPAYRSAVSLYGMTVDPLAQATLEAADGAYDPDRVIKLRRLVDANPEDVRYRFLLAGLYRRGRYFEEAYQEYKQVLALEPRRVDALVNIGNIFYITGQHAEAVANYRRALEIDSGAALAWFNLHLTQSESFDFREAEEALEQARLHDPELVSRLLTEDAEGARAAVRDADLDTASIWTVALGNPGDPSAAEQPAPAPDLLASLANPVSIVCGALLVLCGFLSWNRGGPDPARRCIRCGRPFCHCCKSGRDGREYCRQCYHLFVLGDGLAPQARSRKEYEIDRFERRARRLRRLAALLLPGAGHLLRGRPAFGLLLLTLWLLALFACAPGLLQPVEQLLGLELGLDLLRPGSVPAMYAVQPLAILAAAAALGIWLAGNLRRPRRGEI